MADFPVYQPMQGLFPLLTPQQNSPFGGVLSDAIAKRLAMAKAQEAENAAPYAGLSKLASIRSANAYASNVQPQFQAKIMEQILTHPELRASLQDPKKMLDLLSALGMTGQNANPNYALDQAINKQLLQIQEQKNKPGLLGNLGQSLLSLFTGGEQKPQQAQNELPVYAQQPQNISTQPSIPTSNEGRTPENVAFEERAASTKKQLKKGEALGTKEAEQQAEYGGEAKGIVSQNKAINNLKSIYEIPEIKKIANVPFATGKSLKWYKETGTDKEKSAIGKMESAENSFIASSFSLFPQRVTNVDLQFVKSMKPNENDPLPVRKAKINEIEAYLGPKKQQIKLADHYMSRGMSQAEAEFKADEEITAAARDKAYNKIYPQNEDAAPKEEAKEAGYTKTMWSPPDPVTGKRKKALVHKEDAEAALAEGWTNA